MSVDVFFVCICMLAFAFVTYSNARDATCSQINSLYSFKFMDILATKLDRDPNKQIQEYGRDVMVHIETLTPVQWVDFILDGSPSVEALMIQHTKVSQNTKKKVTEKVDKSINNFVWLCWKARYKQTHSQREQQQHTHNHMHVELEGVSELFVCDSYTCANNDTDNVCEQLV